MIAIEFASEDDTCFVLKAWPSAAQDLGADPAAHRRTCREYSFQS